MIIVYTRPALLFNIYHDVMNFTDKNNTYYFFNFCIFHYSMDSFYFSRQKFKMYGRKAFIYFKNLDKISRTKDTLC